MEEGETNKEKMNTENHNVQEPENEKHEELLEEGAAEETKVHVEEPPQKESRRKKAKKEKEIIEGLEQKVNELNDKYLRLFAEFENYRRRALSERLELIKTASEDIIRQLLPVIDDLHRALKAMEAHEDVESFKEGTELIYNKIKTILDQKGLKEMNTLGEVFNTDLHEAITTIPAASEDMKGKIVEEVQKGYTLNGKVIRYAKVIVGN
jgi:molecular chaperone GrpE